MISGLIRKETSSGCTPRVCSLDVECAAIGRGHDDLSPCRISLVDEKCQVLLDVVINTDNLHSPLTPVTGLTANDLRKGITLKQGLEQLYKLLTSKTTLVGQFIGQDCFWCSLVEGVHYEKLVDLSQCLRIWAVKLNRFLYFSLDRAAYGLLGVESAFPHCPVRDATVSIQIYQQYVKTGELELAKRILQNCLRLRLFPRRVKPRLMSVCCGKFNKKYCTCHQRATCVPI